MTFTNGILFDCNTFLIHNINQKKEYLSLAKVGFSGIQTNENTIKKFIDEYNLTFCNHFVETSYFISYLIDYIKFTRKDKRVEQQKNQFFYYLYIYIKQFHSDFEFLKEINNVSDLINFFSKYYEIFMNFIYNCLDDNNFEYVKKNIELYNNILKFYSIIEDFMIRFYSYSIIGVSDQKCIITACSDCNKRFIDYLMKDYSLFRLQRIGLIEKQDKGIEPYYEFLPVIPTKDVGFPIDEYIETSSFDNKIENKKFVKILK